jgi:phage FluMu protein Com
MTRGDLSVIRKRRKGKSVTCVSCGHVLSSIRGDSTIRIEVPTKAIFVKSNGSVEIRCPNCKDDTGLPLQLHEMYLTQETHNI